MAIHTVRFKYQGDTQWGVLRAGRILPVTGEFPTTGDFLIQNPIDQLKQIDGEGIDPVEVTVLSPVTRNQQFVCQGANYRQHMIESGVDPDAKHFNMIFTKARSCIVPADSNVIRPGHVKFLDYEIELGLVLKREIDGPVQISDDNLLEFVAGIVIVNDYSARDVQIPQMQFYKGKSYRTFGPVGPYLCLLEPADLPQLKRLQLTLRVNGEVRQNDSTENLVFSPAETLNELAGVQDFAPGDLIATGTPAGCALSIPSPLKLRIVSALGDSFRWKMFAKIQAQRTQYLKNGDVVESVIVSEDGAIDLGKQRNQIVQGRS